MEVKARAPGKIILSGEHAVVHGSTAVASSIDLYTYVSLSFPTPSDSDDALRLQLKEVGLEFSWPIGRLKAVLSELDIPNSSVPTSCSLESTKSLAALVDELKIPEEKIGLGAGVLAFLRLYSSIQGFKPGTIVITSELPLGSGLGSSAAFCVALSSALLSFSDSVGLDLSHKEWTSFGESEVDLLNKWAFEGEKIFQLQICPTHHIQTPYTHVSSSPLHGFWIFAFSDSLCRCFICSFSSLLLLKVRSNLVTEQEKDEMDCCVLCWEEGWWSWVLDLLNSSFKFHHAWGFKHVA